MVLAAAAATTALPKAPVERPAAPRGCVVWMALAPGASRMGAALHLAELLRAAGREVTVGRVDDARAVEPNAWWAGQLAAKGCIVIVCDHVTQAGSVLRARQAIGRGSLVRVGPPARAAGVRPWLEPDVPLRRGMPEGLDVDAIIAELERRGAI